MTSKRFRMLFHCRKCMENIPPGESPMTWARLSVGFTKEETILVWCVRHDKRVTEIEIKVGALQ